MDETRITVLLELDSSTADALVEASRELGVPLEQIAEGLIALGLRNTEGFMGLLTGLALGNGQPLSKDMDGDTDA